jgi:hypothetical protein
MAAGIARGEVVHVDATLIRADVSWESLGVRHADAALAQSDGDPTDEPGAKADRPRRVLNAMESRAGAIRRSA